MNIRKDLVAKAAQLTMDIMERGMQASMHVTPDTVSFSLYMGEQPALYCSAQSDLGMTMMIAAMNEVLA